MAIGINLGNDDGDFYGLEKKRDEDYIKYKKLLQEILLFFNKLPNSRANNTNSYKLAEKIVKALK